MASGSQNNGGQVVVLNHQKHGRCDRRNERQDRQAAKGLGPRAMGVVKECSAPTGKQRHSQRLVLKLD